MIGRDNGRLLPCGTTQRVALPRRSSRSGHSHGPRAGECKTQWPFSFHAHCCPSRSTETHLCNGVSRSEKCVAMLLKGRHRLVAKLPSFVLPCSQSSMKTSPEFIAERLHSICFKRMLPARPLTKSSLGSLSSFSTFLKPAECCHSSRVGRRGQSCVRRLPVSTPPLRYSIPRGKYDRKRADSAS